MLHRRSSPPASSPTRSSRSTGRTPSRSPASRQQAVLKQNTTGQAEIVSAIRQFRERHAPDPSVPRWAVPARRSSGLPATRPSRRVEADRNAAAAAADDGPVAAARSSTTSTGTTGSSSARWLPYLAGQPSTFDNRVMLKPGHRRVPAAAERAAAPADPAALGRNGAQLNRLEDSQLEVFLFGADRTPTAKSQGRTCGRSKTGAASIATLALPTRRTLVWITFCRGPVILTTASTTLWSPTSAATGGRATPSRRANILRGGLGGSRATRRECSQLTDLAAESGWDRGGLKTVSVARAIYLRLPEDARLSLRGKDFVVPDVDAIRDALNVERPGTCSTRPSPSSHSAPKYLVRP